jgi:hypothetical protein
VLLGTLREVTLAFLGQRPVSMASQRLRVKNRSNMSNVRKREKGEWFDYAYVAFVHSGVPRLVERKKILMRGA